MRASDVAPPTPEVDISGFAFHPTNIIVGTNLDASMHSVEGMAPDGSIDSDGPLDSPLLATDDTFIFEVPGV